MNKKLPIKGFSKFAREEKIAFISSHVTNPQKFLEDIRNLEHPDAGVQEKLNSFSENTIANFPLPYGIAPNFLINNKTYLVPMVVEESSVVAAASSAAGFWYDKAGFSANVSEMIKTGQIHFLWHDNPEKLKKQLPELKTFIIENTRHLTANMEERGGGIKKIELVDLSEQLKYVYQLRFSFNTADSMGANFINSVLEESAHLLEEYFCPDNKKDAPPVEVIMAILSNYCPECIVKVEVKAPLSDFSGLYEGFSGMDFARRFVQAVNIAENDIYRAVTHNKGIYNGIDAVVIATGNDYRAVEAGGHAYASRKGNYRSLSYADIRGNEFVHGLEVPLVLGTVGGLTRLHPLARWSFDLLGEPGTEELMMIAASAGLANNFSAIRSLITTGIQKGHMKMHLENILSFLNASEQEKENVRIEFNDKTISYSNVENYIKNIRSKNDIQ
ncbi:MAG: hydroxymethylglutaryl-CoA reductase, degradative [Bacteroidota bacterium]